MKLQKMAGCAAAVVLGLTVTSLYTLAQNDPASSIVGPKPATTSAPATAPKKAAPADVASPRGGDKPEAGWMKRHDAYVELAKKGGIDLYFLGDSITDGWHGGGKTVWAENFLGWKPGNFGIGGDRTQHVLWRIQNGEFENVKPKALVLMIGTNNLGGNSDAEIASGITAIVQEIQKQSPATKILLLGIFPRAADPKNPARQRIKNINEMIAKLDDGKTVKYLDIGAKLLTEDGTLSKDIMPDGLHPNAAGYKIWAAAIKPTLTEWLGELPATQPAMVPTPASK